MLSLYASTIHSACRKAVRRSSRSRSFFDLNRKPMVVLLFSMLDFHHIKTNTTLLYLSSGSGGPALPKSISIRNP